MIHLYNKFGLRGYEVEDLVQEVMLKALVKLHLFNGKNGCSFKTWVQNVARNHLCSMSRSVKRRPMFTTDDGTLPHRPYRDDPAQKTLLRSSTKELLSWLRANPDGVKHGWEVLNLLLKTHGDYEYTAFALTMHTGLPWTVQAVRAAKNRISQTPRGRELCSALGITNEEN